jgi:hypothetical protein
MSTNNAGATKESISISQENHLSLFRILCYVTRLTLRGGRPYMRHRGRQRDPRGQAEAARLINSLISLFQFLSGNTQHGNNLRIRRPFRSLKHPIRHCINLNRRHPNPNASRNTHLKLCALSRSPSRRRPLHGHRISLATIFKSSALNTFAALPKTVQNTVRKTLQELLRGVLEEQLSRLQDHSVFPLNAVQMHLPVRIGDFTDFSVSAAHNLRAGEAILGESFLPPAFKHFPISVTTPESTSLSI